MAVRSNTFKVVFQADNDGRITATFADIARSAEQTGRVVDQNGEKWEALGRRIGTALKWAGGVAAAGLALVIANTAKAEQELAQLDAVLLSTGNAAGYTRDQLVAMANELSQKSIFSGGEIIEAETRLLSYTGILGENLPRAMQAVIDQSARLGISVTQSAEIIGRALESPSKAAAALAQQGFGAAFTAEVRETIKALEDAGRAGEAQEIILGILEESYAGAAQAARETFGGSLIALKNTLFDVMTGSDGSLDGTTRSVNDLIDTLNDPAVRDGFDAIITGALGAAGALAEMIGMLGQAIGRTQEWLNLQLGGNRQMGGENLAEQRRELAAINAELEAREGRGITGLSVLGLLTPRQLEERRRQVQELIRFNEDIFGDPSKPVVRFIDPSDPASLGEDRHLRAVSTPRAPVPTGGTSGNARRGRELPDFSEADRRALERMVTEVARADEQFNRLQATLSGPLAEAEYEHQQNLREIAELAATAGRSSEELADLKALETQRYDEERAAIEQQLTPLRELIEEREFELMLMGKSRVEQQTLIDLRRAGVDATSAEAAALRDRNQALDDMQYVIDGMDATRAAGRGLIEDLLSGTKHWRDALDDALENFRSRINALIAEKLIEQLLGSFGTAWGGGGSWASDNGIGAPVQVGNDTSGGGWVQAAVSIFGALFGGKRQFGGTTRPNALYEILEGGAPEVFKAGNRTWMLTGDQPGEVMPMAAGGGGGDVFNVSVHLPPSARPMTANQIANETSDVLRAAQRLRG